MQPYDYMWAMAVSSGYGFTESVLDQQDSHHRASGVIAASVRPFPWLAVQGQLDTRYDRHRAHAPSTDELVDTGWIGAPRLAVRAGTTIKPRLSAGGELSMVVPGDDPFSLALDAIVVDAVGVANATFGSRLTLGVNLGLRLDRSAHSVDDPDALSRADRLALGVSDANALLAAAGVAWRHGEQLELFGEWSWDALIGDAAPALADSPMRAAVGARWHVSDQLAIGGMMHAALSQRPPIGAGAPLVPVEPRVAVTLSVVYRLGSPGRGPSPAVSIEPIARAAPASEDSNHDHNRDGDGAPDSDPDTDTDTPGPDLDTPDAATEPPPPARGELRGLVRSYAGKPLRATVCIEPLALELETDSHGTFAVEVPPGQYTVIIRARGRRLQRRTVHVGDDEVTLLNIDLRSAQHQVPPSPCG